MKRIAIYIIFGYLFFSSISRVAAETEYIVKQGDTLWKIAIKNGMELDTIIQSNLQVSNPHLIFPGQKIYIPSETRIGKNVSLLSHSEKTLLELTNAKRMHSGLKPLKFDHLLSKAAKQKSIDMMEKGYVSHISPSYGNSTDMLKMFQIPFEKVSENIGAGYKLPEEVLSLWMNSSVNQANVLDQMSTHIGVGHAEGGIHGDYWTMLIIKKVEGGR